MHYIGNTLSSQFVSTDWVWLLYKSQLPNLFLLTKKLLNFQASTAFVEFICNVKNTNMSDKVIILIIKVGR